MNKKTMMSVLLVLFAVLAVYVAFMPTAVAVYDMTQVKEPSYCAYFNLVEDVDFSGTLPLAALGACLTLITAGIYVVVKKFQMLSFIKIVSMAASILAVVPVLAKDPETLLVPNVLLPIAMIGEYVVAYYLDKQTDAPEVVQYAGRLKRK